MIEERNSQTCPTCKGALDKIFSTGSSVATGQGYAGWYDNMTDKPVYITSKSHLKEMCIKHNVVPHCLDGWGLNHQNKLKSRS